MGEESYKGHLLLLMAPSGSGKGKIVEALGDLREQMYFAKTFTSRAKRKGTEENPKYVFLTLAEFQKMIDNNEFVEWANFSGNLYGTSKADITGPMKEGRVVFKEMELQGIMQMKKIVGDDHVTVIYIEAGGWEALKKRITSRAEIDEEELKLRGQRYKEESKAKTIADVVISNRDGELESAQQEFRIVVGEIIQKTAK